MFHMQEEQWKEVRVCEESTCELQLRMLQKTANASLLINNLSNLAHLSVQILNNHNANLELLLFPIN